MKRSYITVPAIFLLMVLLIFSPPALAGYQNEKNAREALAAGDILYAAEQFELASRRIFWEPVLWNATGDAYWEAGDMHAMAAAFENARSRSTLNACGWEKLGYFYASDNDHAIQIWKEGLTHYPNHVILYQYLAGISRYHKEYDLELEYLSDALVYEESAIHCDFVNRINFPYMHYRIGVLLMLDDPSRAIEELNTASRLDEEYAPVVETLRTTLNLASLENDPAQKLVLLGRGLALVEEWELAADAFHNATQADSENASAWAWLGQAQVELGQDALPSFEKSASIDPDSPTLLSLRGLYWQRVNDRNAALLDFEKLAKLEPDNPSWHTLLGGLYAELGNLPNALAAYQKATELEPTEPVYRQLLALFSFDYRYDLAGTGLSAARRAVILAPEEARYIDTLGLIYFGLDRDEDAERQFLRALEKDAEYAAAHLHLGMLYLKGGDRGLAYSSLLQAQEFAQDDALRAETQRLLDEYFQE